MRTQPLFNCPVCRRELQSLTDCYVCDNGHRFDRARSGYVHLSRSHVRGDTAAMLHARRSFLDAGFQTPMSDGVNRCAAEHLKRVRHLSVSARGDAVVDVGCGEGYYLARLHAHLAAQSLAYDVSFVGVDVSVAATRLTAGRLGGVATAVVDVHDSLYIRDRAATVIVNVFAPRNGDEFARILAPAGLCLVIVPEADHLREVRQRFKLLDIPGGKAHRVQRQFAPVLRLQSEYRIRASARFDSSALEALVRMTPNAWHLTPDRVTAIRRVSSMDSTISCVLLCFTRETQGERRRTERVSRVLRRARVASLGPGVATRTATMSPESIRLSEYPFTDSSSPADLNDLVTARTKLAELVAAPTSTDRIINTHHSCDPLPVRSSCSRRPSARRSVGWS